MQYFINYNYPSGWYLTSAPIITANWEADSGNQWTVPFGGGVGKVFAIGRQPLNINTQVFYNVDKPTFGARMAVALADPATVPRSSCPGCRLAGEPHGAGRC